MRRLLLLVLLAAASAFAQDATPEKTKRPLRLDDLYQLRTVTDPQRSPDGQWVAFTVSSVDVKKDKNISHLWLASWDGKQERQLTFSDEGESTPRWSADGRQLAFLSSRTDECEKSQIWLLPMAGGGGEAAQVTKFRRDISDFAWAPDGKRLVLVVEDDPDEMKPEKPEADATKPKPKAEPSASGESTKEVDEGCPLKDKKPKPIEVTRYKFKEDITGYLTRKRSHLYLLDLETRKATVLTPGDSDELMPAWSPDGKWIAFVSKRHPADPDRGDNWDVLAIEPRVGAKARELTTSVGQDNPPITGSPLAWSPDGTRVAYIAGLADPKLYAYDQRVLAVVSVDGTAREITRGLDRSQFGPQWSADGQSVGILLEDDRTVLPINVDVATGKSTPLLRGALTVASISSGNGGASFAALVSSDNTPDEVVAIEKGEMRRLSHQNDKWLSEIQLAPVEDFTSRSSDGTEVHGLITKPVGSSEKLPTLLRIHGGPDGQDQHEFRFDWQLFAANGYAVIAANYRGSAGRGTAHQRAIYADWGHKEVIDLLGAVDHAVKIGLADPAKLGVGGWSYGGILTDYIIASDTRFKAATSGAGSALTLAMYGVDEYVTQYTLELGPPWKTTDLWLKLSPFLHADRIKTPTLFLGGDKDFNVPLIGGEQMYQALRELNVPTELVVYPGEFHGIKRPSFKRHRLDRYVKWYDRWVKGTVAPSAAATAK